MQLFIEMKEYIKKITRSSDVKEQSGACCSRLGSADMWERFRLSELLGNGVAKSHNKLDVTEFPFSSFSFDVDRR